MGDWSEAMDDGVICRGCALPLGTTSSNGYCPDCKPSDRQPQAQPESAIDRARNWKARTEK